MRGSGSRPAGYTTLPAAPTMSCQPARNQQPAIGGLNSTLPAAEAAALTATTTKASNSRLQRTPLRPA